MVFNRLHYMIHKERTVIFKNNVKVTLVMLPKKSKLLHDKEYIGF